MNCVIMPGGPKVVTCFDHTPIFFSHAQAEPTGSVTDTRKTRIKKGMKRRANSTYITHIFTIEKKANQNKVYRKAEMPIERAVFLFSIVKGGDVLLDA